MWVLRLSVIAFLCLALPVMAQAPTPRTEAQWVSTLTAGQLSDVTATLARVLAERDQLSVQLQQLQTDLKQCKALQVVVPQEKGEQQ